MEERYRGMSYEQASREGLRLIQGAAQSASWLTLPEKLIALRSIMLREAQKKSGG